MDDIPSNQQLYEMILQLQNQVKQLQQQIYYGKSRTSSRNLQKMAIIQQLNTGTDNKTYIPWRDYQYQINVTVEHLKIIAEHSLLDGIKQCILDDMDNLPVKIYADKMATLFVYGITDDTWTIFEFENFAKWIKDIKHGLLQQFLIFANDNDNNCDNNEETNAKNVERNILQMQKIMGGNVEKDAKELYKWLYDKLKM